MTPGNIATAEPRVTVCIPTYNRAGYLEAAIRSALAQTYGNLTVRVVDNCSTDGTVGLLQRFRREHPDRFEYAINPTNLGPQGNFTRCLEVAEGEYFKILCSDDVAYPTLVEKQVRALQANPRAVAATARRRRLSGSLLFRLYDPLLAMHPGLWKGPDAVRYVFRVSNMIGGPVQVLARLEPFRSVRFRSDPVVGGMYDIEPLLRLLAIGRDLVVMDEILCDYNSEASSHTTATLTRPEDQDYYFAFRDEQTRDPLYARCLRLPDDLKASRRNAAALLLLAGFAAAFRDRDPGRVAPLYDFLESRHPATWVKLARAILELGLRVPGRRACSSNLRQNSRTLDREVLTARKPPPNK